jgi:hypothetical protein
MHASNQRHEFFVATRWAAASLTALVLVFGIWNASARAAEIEIPFESGIAIASFQWNHGDITKDDADVLPDAHAAAENPAQIKISAYQNNGGVNAVSADSGSALSEAPDFHALARTNYEFSVKSKHVQIGRANFTFVINGGELRIKNFRSPGEIMGSAHVGANLVITTPSGRAEWKLDASLSKVGGAPHLDRPPGSNVDNFGIGFPTLTPVMIGDDAVVDIPRFQGTIPIDLGDLFTGIHFIYDMEAGLDLDAPLINSVGGFARIGDPFSLSMGGPSTNGVEFFLDGMPLGSFPIGEVPEPTSAILLMIGVMLTCNAVLAVSWRVSA